jgi:hypothetical protein
LITFSLIVLFLCRFGIVLVCGLPSNRLVPTRTRWQNACLLFYNIIIMRTLNALLLLFGASGNIATLNSGKMSTKRQLKWLTELIT